METTSLNNQSNVLFGEYSARVKDIYIELPNYRFYHSPSPLNKDLSEGTENRFEFIGREKIMSQLKNVLTEVNSRSGSYLITGFRGMGKTSLVRKVVEEINFEFNSKYKRPKYVPIEISLSQDDIRDIDVLRLIARRLQDEIGYISQNINARSFDYKKKKLHMLSYLQFLYRYYINPKKLPNITPIRNIIKDIQILNERISATVSLEHSLQYGMNSGIEGGASDEKWKFGATFNEQNKKSSIYAPANSKEIEMELIRILDNIDKVRGLVKDKKIPELLFVFDELDKIEPNYSTALSEKEAEDPHYESIRNSFLADRIRRRQDIVGRLLANLKNFLNISRAKFIFIGGREMYDASLADIADRDTFYGSIFSRVFYVESFLKDDSNDVKSNLSGMVEKYLSCVLLPNHPSTDWSLSMYREHLSKTLNYEPEESEKKEIITQKTIILLQNFIAYLTYRSSGTPRKLASLIETYIVSVKEQDIPTIAKNSIIIHSNTKKEGVHLFLKFGYKDQFDIGITSIVYRPFLIYTSRFLKSASDSLLFSTSFIIDHILKFHPFAFSWNNLEVIPEIITVNKAPYLRQYIEDILSFYMGGAIRTTNAGIFRFKFYSKYAAELKFISKMSDLSNAAYNFTLDESLLIKRYYKRKLKEMDSFYVNYKSDPDKSRHLYSMGFLNSLIGDLHFYDKEYDDAIIHYINAVQHLRSLNSKDINEQQAINLVINEQKLALCYEKIQMYEMAFTIYKRLIDSIPYIFKDLKTRSSEEPVVFINDRFSYIGLSIVIQPYLSLLHLIEKFRVDGFTETNFKHVKSMLNELLLGDSQEEMTASKHSELLNTIKYSFYLNLGTIVFYKNALLTDEALDVENRKPQHYPYLSQIEQIKQLKCHSMSAFDLYNQSLWWFGLRFKFDLDVTDKDMPYFLKVISFLLFDKTTHINASHYDDLGNIISKCGDAYLTMIPPSNRNEINIDLILRVFREDHDKSSITQAYLNLSGNSQGSILNLNGVIGIYYFSYLAFKRASKLYSAAFMLKKILWILNEFLSSQIEKDQSGFTKDNFMQLKQIIVKPLLETISKSSFSSARLQILKFKDTLGYERNLEKYRENIYTSLTTSGEVREVLILTALIEIKLLHKGVFNLFELSFHYKDRLISPYSITSFRFTRLLELQYRNDYNYQIFKLLKFEGLIENWNKQYYTSGENKERLSKIIYEQKIKDHLKEVDSEQITNNIFHDKLETPSGFSLLEFLVSDSIFCLSEMLRSTNIYGMGYITTYSWMGYVNYKMAKWCHIYRTLLRSQFGADQEKSIYQSVKKLISESFMFHLETNYYYEIALNYFDKATQLHTQGSTYKTHVKGMYYAEDDLSDNFSHFLASLERYRINIGNISAITTKISDKQKKSTLYRPDSYGLNYHENSLDEDSPDQKNGDDPKSLT